MCELSARGAIRTFKGRGIIEEIIQSAESKNKVIMSARRLLYDFFTSLSRGRQLGTCISGTLVAYDKTKERFGKEIEWYDEKTNKRWIFLVPEELREKTGMLLVDHPFWVIETDGNNRIVHTNPKKIIERANFPIETGCYLGQADYTFIQRVEKSELKAAIEKRGMIPFERDGWSGIVYSDLFFLNLRPTYVGPLCVKETTTKTVGVFHISTFNPMHPYSLLALEDAKLSNQLFTLSLDHPLRKLRGIDHIPSAIVVIGGTNQRIEVPRGESLRSLRDLVSGLKFDCERGSCRTCEIKVINGMENLTETSINERVLQRTRSDSKRRLACSANITGEEVIIELVKK